MQKPSAHSHTHAVLVNVVVEIKFHATIILLIKKKHTIVVPPAVLNNIKCIRPVFDTLLKVKWRHSKKREEIY